MIHNDSWLLKESVDIPVQLKRVYRPIPFHVVNYPNDNNLPWQEIASSEYAAPPIANRVKHSHVVVIELPCAGNIVR